MDNIKLELENLYKSKNILFNNNDVLLHENCICKDKCWDPKSLIKRSGNWNRIAYPFIGNKYNGDLMCVGLNLNGFGGENALIELINGNHNNIGVKNYLKKGIKKINFGNKKEDYAGTLFWYKIAVYSYIILNNSISTDDYIKLSDIYDRLVFLEAIKCSPKGNKSKPEKNMNYYCPNEFLISEINILNPKMILLFGNSVSNYFKVNEFLVNDIKYSKSKKIELFKISVNNKIIDVVKIIHPTAFGGNNNTFYKELYNLLNVNL